jgi:hypothetical protein
MSVARKRELHWSEVPWLLRKLGVWAIEDRSLRARWGEIAYRGFGFGLGYSVYHENANWRVCLGWPDIYIKAPMLIRQQSGTEDWCANYGFSYHARAIHLNWRRCCKIVHLPWDWQHVRHEVYLADGSRVEPAKHEYEPPFSDGREVEVHPYTYVLKNGTVQNRAATITGEEREWRWLWFQWLPWPRKISRSIDIRFDDEVGERSGSWKGGTTGCGYEWRKGETMLDALRRMERDRKM